MICPKCHARSDPDPRQVDQPLGTPGGGRYDADCEAVLKQTQAQSVLLIVLGGERGSGISHTGDEKSKRELPDLLETAARRIREAQRRGLHP